MPRVEKDDDAIRQRWDNFGMEVANFVISNTDIIILTFFSVSLVEISVYTVYNMVMRGDLGMFAPFVLGISTAFGDMMAR